MGKKRPPLRRQFHVKRGVLNTVRDQVAARMLTRRALAVYLASFGTVALEDDICQTGNVLCADDADRQRRVQRQDWPTERNIEERRLPGGGRTVAGIGS